MTADIVLCNGTVFDGTGGPPQRASVAIAEGNIIGVGEFSAGDARRVIDASDLAIAPGFIDIHTHSDVTLMLDPRCQSKILRSHFV